MSESSKVVLHLFNQLEEFGAVDGHFTMYNVESTKGKTAVISVYDGIKPSHMVLEELYSWACNHNVEIKEKIEQLEQDMSWNEEHPI